MSICSGFVSMEGGNRVVGCREQVVGRAILPPSGQAPDGGICIHTYPYIHIYIYMWIYIYIYRPRPDTEG